MFFDNVKNEAQQKSNLAAQLKKHKDLSLESDDYIIRAYKDYDELVAEGNSLQNAIAYFALTRYSDGDDMLFTFRLAKEPDKSYGALEFTPEGNLRLAEYDCIKKIVSSRELGFIEQFRKNVLLPFIAKEKGIYILPRDNKLAAHEFRDYLTIILSENNKIAVKWVAWAHEIESQYLSSVPEELYDSFKADTYLKEFAEIFENIKILYGEEIVRRIVRLPEYDIFLYPWELTTSAEYLHNGGTETELQKMKDDGLLHDFKSYKFVRPLYHKQRSYNIIKSRKIFTAEEYLKAMIGQDWRFNNYESILRQMEKLLLKQSLPYVSYDFDCMNYIIENNIPVVLVDCGETIDYEQNIRQLRWFYDPKTLFDGIGEL